MQRRTFFAQFVAFIAFAALAGCSNSDKPGTTDAPKLAGGTAAKRIVILTNGSAPYWDAAAAGAKDAEKDFKTEAAGFQLTFDRGDFTVETQLNKLRQYANASDVAAIAISVTDAANQALVEELKKLNKAGIKVVTIDSDVNREANVGLRFAYLGTDNKQAGQMLGKAAKGLVENGNYAAFVGLKEAANALDRVAGFQEAGGASYKQLDYLGDSPEGEVKARSNVRDALERNKDLNVLVGIWSYNTPAIVDIVKQLEARSQVKIVGFDADPGAISGMQAGMVDAMIVQNPYEMGYQGVRILKALVEKDEATIKLMFPKHGEVGGDIYDTGLKIVVPDEGSPLKGDLFDANTKFLKLSEFQVWLDKYSLTGS